MDMKNSSFSKIFTDYRQFEVLVLGVFSGMPLSVLFNTMMAWLHESNVVLEVITTFAVARLPYSFKPLWAPFIDYVKIPVLGRIGHRKSWMIIWVIVISAILFAMSQVSPSTHLHLVYVLSILLGFASASFDITFDAFHIERFSKELQGIAVANVTLGYRMGLLLAGAGALYFAEKVGSWPQTFIALSVIYLSSILFIITIKEDELIREKIDSISVGSVTRLIVGPFRDFLSKDKALVILLAIILFKLGDAMLGIVAMPFYLEIGFTKSDIAVVSKIFGVIATIVGVYGGGMLFYRLGAFKTMIITGIAQNVTNASFIWLNHHPGEMDAFYIAIAVENFAGGMGAGSITAYLSGLCNTKYCGTQYALFSSAATLCNNTIVTYGGTLARSLGWDYYFGLTALLGFPAILILIYLHYSTTPTTRTSSINQQLEVV